MSSAGRSQPCNKENVLKNDEQMVPFRMLSKETIA